MNVFDGRVAIITGGASGIGRALAEELVAHGCRVVLADINGAQAEQVAAGLRARGAAAESAPVDVRDAEAVRALVEKVGREGRLDYLFNNAGVATFGEARDMALADWNRIIDVNLRGVVNGVVAAYPLMIRQGGGHIVNTASAAGLAPTPSATAYAMTKHAVVGLSTSLRGEAARFGVRVSAVCPGFIDTPLKDSLQLLNCDRETALRAFPLKLHPADECARVVLRGVARNRPIIVVTSFARLAWLVYRLSPSLAIRLAQSAAARSPLLESRKVVGC